jgi:hypothetical protein
MTLTLTIEQINVILNALGAAPYAQVANLIAEIQKQGQEQLAASASAEVKE